MYIIKKFLLSNLFIVLFVCILESKDDFVGYFCFLIYIFVFLLFVEFYFIKLNYYCLVYYYYIFVYVEYVRV